MDCKLKVGDKVLSTLNYKLNKSDFFCGLLEFCDVNTVLQFPPIYNKVADYYLRYASINQPLFNVKITQPSTLKLCLEMAHYLADVEFFEVIMNQLLSSWYELHIVIDDLHPELQRDVYLHCPYMFIPQTFVDDDIFFKAWLDINNNKGIVVNHNDNNINMYISYYIQYFAVTVLMSTLTQNDNVYRHGYRKEWRLNSNNTYSLISCAFYDYDRLHGQYKSWCYQDNNLIGYIRNVSHYENGNLLHDSEYDINGQVICEQHFIDGKKTGTWKKRDSSKQLVLEVSYLNDVKHGPYRGYYIISSVIEKQQQQLLSQTSLSDSKQEQREEQEERQGEILLPAFEYHFEYDGEVGMFREWYHPSSTLAPSTTTLVSGQIKQQLKYEHTFRNHGYENFSNLDISVIKEQHKQWDIDGELIYQLHTPHIDKWADACADIDADDIKCHPLCNLTRHFTRVSNIDDIRYEFT